jgi:hypothetical protein
LGSPQVEQMAFEERNPTSSRHLLGPCCRLKVRNRRSWGKPRQLFYLGFPQDCTASPTYDVMVNEKDFIRSIAGTGPPLAQRGENSTASRIRGFTESKPVLATFSLNIGSIDLTGKKRTSPNSLKDLTKDLTNLTFFSPTKRKIFFILIYRKVPQAQTAKKKPKISQVATEESYVISCQSSEAIKNETPI